MNDSNGNKIGQSSNSTDEDLSSDYTDPGESSAPTELLAEFLSAVMLHDYAKAYKYCKRILDYEPNNSSAKEFFPLIKQKMEAQSNENEEQEDAEVEEGDDGEEEEDPEEYDNYRWQDEASDLSSPKSTTSSKNYDCESGDEVEDIPESEAIAIAAKPQRSGGSTTESYSSVLQELEDEEDCDILKDLLTDIANGNHVKLSPDSESFTTSEQLTQRFVDIYITENCAGLDEGE